MTNTEVPGASRETVKPVVTIFESYGSGMMEVGPQVAQALGLPFHQQAFSSEQLETQEEQQEKEGLLSRVMEAMGAVSSRDGLDVVFEQQDRASLVAQNTAAVQSWASEGGVITGRNGTMILADRPATLHVRLDGPEERRVERAAREAGISLERARKRQRREDRIRAEMSVQLYGWDPRRIDHYDLVLNTTLLSPRACVNTIVAALTAKGVAG